MADEKVTDSASGQTSDVPDTDASKNGSPSSSGDKGKGKAVDAGKAPSKSRPTIELSTKAAQALMESNPALKGEFAGLDEEKAAEMMRKMDISELLAGLAVNPKNQKDMASYKFWQTQPVIRFDDKGEIVDGPIKEIDIETVSKTPGPLIDGFEWVTLNLNDDRETQELYELLTDHYVEDDSAMFRFNYSKDFLNWALKAPGWTSEWHVGVRASKSRKLVAAICGIPIEISVRGKKIKSVGIDFLCVHKKLRAKRLAPVLIKEITRRCYLRGVFQAVYTVGIVLPTPISSCRYYHRALDWLKLYEVGFSGLPTGSTKARQVARNQLPSETSTPGLRPMQVKDISAVSNLMNRYMERFDLSQTFSEEEIKHLFINGERTSETVVYSFVVEEQDTHQITDFVSFYSLESSVIQNEKHSNVRAAYLYYYASETAFAEKEKGLKERLQLLINDALIIAKKEKFDVFNALTLHDNPLFLEKLKFGAGDGQLHYYLFNYRTAPIAGGVDSNNEPDERKRYGVVNTVTRLSRDLASFQAEFLDKATTRNKRGNTRGRQDIGHTNAREGRRTRAAEKPPTDVNSHNYRNVDFGTSTVYTTVTMGAGHSTDSREHGASPEEMSQVLARRFASKCFTPLELAHLKDNFNSLALKQGDIQYWNEVVLSKFLGIPDGDSRLGNKALDAGPVIFRMVSYLGAFPFQNTLAPSVLTFDAMVKVIVLLTERYGKVLRRGRKDRIKLLFGSMADVGRKGDVANLNNPPTDEKPGSSPSESRIQSYDPGFSIDKPSNDDEGEHDDDDLVLAALESLDAIEVFKHDQRIDRTVYEAHISVDTFQRLLMLLVVLSPLRADEETSKYFSQTSEESLESARDCVKNIIASFNMGDSKDGIDFATFSRVISTSLPYLFDPLTPLFEHLLFSKNLDLSRRKDSGISSPTDEQKMVSVPQPAPSDISITLPGSFDSCILNSQVISHLSFFLPTSFPATNLLQNGTRLHGVFSSDAHGESLTSFSHNVLTWDAPSILLLTGVKKDNAGNEGELITVGAYLPHAWKSSSTTSPSHAMHDFSDPSQLPYLFQLSPEHVVMHGSPSINSLKSNMPVVSFSTKYGIAIGCKMPPPSRKSLSGDSILPTPAGGGSILIDPALENAEFVISNGLSHGEGVFLPPGITSSSPSRSLSSSASAAASETINISIYNIEVWGIFHTMPASGPSTSRHSRTSTANGEIPDAIARQQAHWNFEAREAERRREIHLNVGGGDSEEQTGRALLEMAGIIGDSSRMR
ncbi:uncharacterized protein GIQ15_03291 [Arthroderma uncinatum]|uniref:uncharacterized protein n=1 Tax=Arthroderma uncinatum TaxID=74035 RepID=UPI00144AB788|nr:uncharacterized protein GIQ15_03291 [Arthroderma uncinatum]KAF3483967.1 hypothetical protein GIQ15_03291 [Arthroderma uncinatum]